MPREERETPRRDKGEGRRGGFAEVEGAAPLLGELGWGDFRGGEEGGDG